MRKTKIICTLGPATEKNEMLQELMLAGADVFRINMSHAEHAWVRDIVPRARKFANDLEHPLAILLDTQGPAIRTGALAHAIELNPGDLLELTVRGAKGEAAYSVDVNYDGLIDDVSLGNKILIDNGLLQLVVMKKGKNRILCKALTAGTLGSRRHINLPGVHVNLPPLTNKDLRDVDLGVELAVDFVALSFARQTSDLEALRKVLAEKENKSTARIVAKIEEQSAVKQIDEMIKTADATMVARGDLGIECPMEELPIIQRRIVKRSLRIGKPVIVATHMLESMIVNPVPTRAEITDVANAVFEQADGIMLSGETSMGRYPVECVKVLDRVARRIERSGGAGFSRDAILENLRQKTVASAVVLANSLPNAKLIVFTRHGTMARYVANMRPEHAPIFAFTPSESVYRQLALCWGTAPVRLDFTADPNGNITAAENYLRVQRLSRDGDNLVIISDTQSGDAMVDCVQLRKA
ncbi:MAG TPA: pyruvate kinase [Chthoniobacterales bacterium]|jgi:pyruvate kinase|nr:pyruvate kinase [Chthoniobacterales bacterium]